MRLPTTSGPSGLIVSGLLLVVVLAAWEVAVRALEVPSYLVPTPSAVATAFWRGTSSNLYFVHLQVTFIQIVLGFLIGSGIGFIVGAAIALNRILAYYLHPYVLVFQTIPKVALAPLIVLWFGLGMTSKIVAAGLICFFPVMVNTIAGLNAADHERIALLRSMDASRLQIFWMLRLPTAGPYIFAGLEIAVTFALIGTIVTEFLGAEAGLGMLMQSMNFTMDVAGSFSVLVLLSIVGVVLTAAITFLRRRVLFWDGQNSDLQNKQLKKREGERQ
jgi:NitT/TauT family transport system permease protein